MATVFSSCSKTENLGPSEKERNEMKLSSSAFVSNKYNYTDPGVVFNGTVIVPLSIKQRHTIIEFQTDGKYKFYYSPNGTIGFLYDEDALTIGYQLDYPKLFVEGKNVTVSRNSNNMLEFKLDTLTFTAESKF
ncbi:MAG TPA: hypothetical protein VF421_16690 [Niabella sp.]